MLDLGGRFHQHGLDKEPNFSLSEEYILKRKIFLSTCPLGSFIKWVGSLDTISNLVVHEWGVVDRLNITSLMTHKSYSNFLVRRRMMKIFLEKRGSLCM